MKSLFNFTSEDFEKNPIHNRSGESMKYYNLKEPNHFGLFGSDVLHESGFHRFSLAERNQVKPVNPDAAWHSLCSTGIQAKFCTDAAEISVRVQLLMPSNMENMSAIGQSGVDLYFWNETVSEFCLLDVSRFDFHQDHYEVSFGHFHDEKKRSYLLNLPLYMGAVEVLMGINDEAVIVPEEFGQKGRIAVYGTSIIQGGCVSRPGMLITNMLSRWLDQEFLNFGFSGAALSEQSVAAIIGSRPDLELLIIDIEANAGTSDLMEKRLPTFLAEFRKSYPSLPIFLVSRTTFALDHYDENRIHLRSFYQDWLRKQVRRWRKEGQNIHFINGSVFFPKQDADYTVDGVHPSDLGAFVMAKAYYKQIKKVLK
jgi:lysophospholipase L1-like esterase